jgi:hypothetical protein
VEAVVDDVGEVAFEGAAGFARCFAFADLAGEVGAGAGVDAGLGDGDAVQGGVDLAVSAAWRRWRPAVVPEPQGMGAMPP